MTERWDGARHVQGRCGARSSESGQGTVEFALAMIVFLLLTMGIVDFARGFFTQEVMQQAATAGARKAAVCQYRDTSAHSSAPTLTASIDYAIWQSLFSLD